MARPIDRDPTDPSVPLWLSQGRRTAEIADEGARAGLSSNAVAEQIQVVVQLPAHRAREHERAFRFLMAHYPDYVAEKKVDANYVAVSQLHALHRLDSAKAAEVAPGVLSGEIKALALRGVIDSVLASKGTGDQTRGLESKRRVADFVSDATERLMANPALLGIGPVDEVREFRTGPRFAPDLGMRQGRRWIAVEISTASASMPPHQVGRYLARLAQLEQKYDRAILVLPHDRGDIAEMVRRFQEEWIGREAEVVLLERSAQQEEA
ncbi:MAG: hypothetical protein PWP11_2625 [Thauera sp.]|nr:hypothetical protein [Thauera sp.]MDI3491348.1 hypothetical protein [Thauera sp.]